MAIADICSFQYHQEGHKLIFYPWGSALSVVLRFGVGGETDPHHYSAYHLSYYYMTKMPHRIARSKIKGLKWKNIYSIISRPACSRARDVHEKRPGMINQDTREGC